VPFRCYRCRRPQRPSFITETQQRHWGELQTKLDDLAFRQADDFVWASIRADVNVAIKAEIRKIVQEHSNQKIKKEPDEKEILDLTNDDD